MPTATPKDVIVLSSGSEYEVGDADHPVDLTLDDEDDTMSLPLDRSPTSARKPASARKPITARIPIIARTPTSANGKEVPWFDISSDEERPPASTIPKKAVDSSNRPASTRTGTGQHALSVESHASEKGSISVSRQGRTPLQNPAKMGDPPDDVRRGNSSALGILFHWTLPSYPLNHSLSDKRSEKSGVTTASNLTTECQGQSTKSFSPTSTSKSVAISPLRPFLAASLSLDKNSTVKNQNKISTRVPKQECRIDRSQLTSVHVPIPDQPNQPRELLRYISEPSDQSPISSRRPSSSDPESSHGSPVDGVKIERLSIAPTPKAAALASSRGRTGTVKVETMSPRKYLAKTSSLADGTSLRPISLDSDDEEDQPMQATKPLRVVHETAPSSGADDPILDIAMVVVGEEAVGEHEQPLPFAEAEHLSEEMTSVEPTRVSHIAAPSLVAAASSQLGTTSSVGNLTHTEKATSDGTSPIPSTSASSSDSTPSQANLSTLSGAQSAAETLIRAQAAQKDIFVANYQAVFKIPPPGNHWRPALGSSSWTQSPKLRTEDDVQPTPEILSAPPPSPPTQVSVLQQGEEMGVRRNSPPVERSPSEKARLDRIRRILHAREVNQRLGKATSPAHLSPPRAPQTSANTHAQETHGAAPDTISDPPQLVLSSNVPLAALNEAPMHEVRLPLTSALGAQTPRMSGDSSSPVSHEVRSFPISRQFKYQLYSIRIMTTKWK